ncbi:MAG: dimethylmenaquinone methyltransferase [Candidatus Solibacter sp.]|nr:dimethylmenaquinone methyltransferase [Candidatus Solibacter sp.]
MPRNATQPAITTLATLILAASLCPAQINNLTREELIGITAVNPYERFPDGRPKVPDSVLKQLGEMSSEEFLGAGARGSVHYAGGFQLLSPGKRLIGRAFTVQLMPIRTEVADPSAAAWKAKGNQTPLNHQAAIDMLQHGDVLVVDAGGNASGGGIVGDNLAYYIWKKTGAGFVIDGAIRDLEGIAPFGMPGYFRAAVPPAIRGLMVTGINVPVRIGDATVLPGDVVFGDREGVTFVPPDQIQRFIDTARITRIHDVWTKKKFDEGIYKSTDIYGRPRDPKLIQEYEAYLKQELGAEAYEAYRKRTAQPAPAPAKPPR